MSASPPAYRPCLAYSPGAFDLTWRQMMKQFRRQLAPVAEVFWRDAWPIAEVRFDVFGDVAAELWASVTLEDADAGPENPRLRSGEPA